MFTGDPQPRIARKQHGCTWCAENIDPGALYIYSTGVDGGHWYTNKLHVECADALREEGGDYYPYQNERPEIDLGKLVALHRQWQEAKSAGKSKSSRTVVEPWQEALCRNDPQDSALVAHADK